MRQLAIFLVILATFYSSQAEEAFCSLPYDEGTITDGNFEVYLYYDYPTQKCSLFKYYGSGGNNNRFRSEAECMRNCSHNWASTYPENRRDACLFKKQAGECLGRYLRFYYDPVYERCHSFFWTGCVGNSNRFLDIASCNTTCRGVTDEGEDPEEEEHDVQVGVIIGILLAVLGIGILVAVIVLAVQSTKSKKAPKDTATSKGKVRKDEDIEMNPSED